MKQNSKSRALAVFGTGETQPPVKHLKLGALTSAFSAGHLMNITYQGVEVLRGISYLVRDENWGTCATEISKVKVSQKAGHRALGFSMKAIHGSKTLVCQANIKLQAGRLTFTVTATPDQDFKTNRTGFVVLHPIAGLAGKPLTITHTDGSVQKSRFPKRISPGQPFFNIRALQHAPAPGLKAHVLMEGNKFEMEDQRNWGDASYKTYVCSLLDPWPYVLKAGQAFTQEITLTLTGNAKSHTKVKSIAAQRKLPLVRLPQLGLSISEGDVDATLIHCEALQKLSPHFLMGHFEVGKTRKATLKKYAEIVAATGLAFRIEIVLSAKRKAAAEMAEVAQALRAAALSPEAVIVTQMHDLKSFQPGDVRPWGPSYRELAAAARKHFPKAKRGGGMISFFTELNRKPVPQGLFDFITHSFCPIVHDASDAAVLQTLETLPHIFASARAMVKNQPYHLGPTTIAARMNPYGRTVADNPTNIRMCLAPNDPRQAGSFAAAWNLGLIAAAAKAGVQSLCLGPLCGPRGLLSAQGKPLPLYELMQQVLALPPGRLRFLQKDGITGLAGGNTALVANTSLAPLPIKWNSRRMTVDGCEVKRLDFGPTTRFG